MAELSHVDESGAVRMVDVGREAVPAPARRRARARSRWPPPTTAAASATCRRATRWRPRSSRGSWPRSGRRELIPLCHPLPLTHVEVDARGRRRRVEIVASAETTAQTGVEMEALTGGARRGAHGLRHGEGDRQADDASPSSWSRRRRSEGGGADRLRPRLARRGRGRERRPARRAACAATATRSSAASSRTRRARSRRRSRSSRRAPRVVLTTGGTGLAPRDVTPEATRTVLEREAPGIAEAIRADSIAKTPHGLLSRGAAGVVGSTLVVNLPGSPGGCRDGYAVLRPALAPRARAARATSRPTHQQT